MSDTPREIVRQQLREALDQHGDHQAFADDESLFQSGRLDSFAMMNLVMFLEERFALDFSELEFDMALLDSVEAVLALIEAQRS